MAKTIYAESEVIIQIVSSIKSVYCTYLALLGIQTLCGKEHEIICFKEALQWVQKEDKNILLDAQNSLPQ